MRILVLTNMLPSSARPSRGVFVQEQIEDLRRLGLEVSVLVIDGSASRVNYLRSIPRVRACLGAFPVDLVHAHYGLTGAVAVTQRRAPVVTTFHGSDCSGEIPWQKAVSWGVARTCTPIFVSNQLAVGIGCPGAAVIPAAVDLDVFHPVDKALAREELGWPGDGEIALLPGSRSDPAKGASLFDAALKRARRTLPGLNGASLEGLTREQVALTMNAADVTVMTSRAEGSPVAIRESLACLTPVVSVPVGDVERHVSGLPGCAVVPRDPDRIAHALPAAIAAGRSAALRERVTPFGRPATATRVVKVYRSILAGQDH